MDHLRKEHADHANLTSEIQRLSTLIDERTRRSTFNVITSIAVAVFPAVALSGEVDSRLYLAAPVFLSIMPLSMLEEDKETRATRAWLAHLICHANRQTPTAGLFAPIRSDAIPLSRLLLYGLFGGIWVASWLVGGHIALTHDRTSWPWAVGYLVILGYVVLAAISATVTRNEFVSRDRTLQHRSSPCP